MWLLNMLQWFCLSYLKTALALSQRFYRKLLVKVALELKSPSTQFPASVQNYRSSLELGQETPSSRAVHLKILLLLKLC